MAARAENEPAAGSPLSRRNAHSERVRQLRFALEEEERAVAACDLELQAMESSPTDAPPVPPTRSVRALLALTSPMYGIGVISNPLPPLPGSLSRPPPRSQPLPSHALALTPRLRSPSKGIAWGAQYAKVTPILQQLGLAPWLLSVAWLAGPVSGLVVQPLVGQARAKAAATARTLPGPRPLPPLRSPTAPTPSRASSPASGGSGCGAACSASPSPPPRWPLAQTSAYSSATPTMPPSSPRRHSPRPARAPPTRSRPRSWGSC